VALFATAGVGWYLLPVPHIPGSVRIKHIPLQHYEREENFYEYIVNTEYVWYTWPPVYHHLGMNHTQVFWASLGEKLICRLCCYSGAANSALSLALEFAAAATFHHLISLSILAAHGIKSITLLERCNPGAADLKGFCL
jgi:hypothetical protein